MASPRCSPGIPSLGSLLLNSLRSTQNSNDNKQKCSWDNWAQDLRNENRKVRKGMGWDGKDLLDERQDERKESTREWCWEWQFGMVEMLLSFVGLYISSFSFVSRLCLCLVCVSHFSFLVYWIRSMATMATISVAYFCGSVSPILPAILLFILLSTHPSIHPPPSKTN